MRMRCLACWHGRSVQVPQAVSILVSSDFLQMRRLVDECLGFIGDHLSEIVKLPIDLSCLSDRIVLQLAKVRFVAWSLDWRWISCQSHVLRAEKCPPPRRERNRQDLEFDAFIYGRV